jgi:anthranilate phosphoribosyltransferase
MIGGGAAPYETAFFLAALRPERCSPQELAAMAAVMQAHAVRLAPLRTAGILGDNCGTGGDNLHLFNVSTAAMFVMAAAGVPIAKHGNRASTSRCGSADVLEALGARIDLGPEAVARCIEACGIGFMFAPRYHPAMKNVSAVRKALPFRTVFNLLGPLCNPAPVTFQLLGVYHPDSIEPAARALSLLGRKRALIVCGATGRQGTWMDEVSISGPTRAALVEDGAVRGIMIEPDALGIPAARLEALRGGAPSENAALLRGVLGGTDRGPRRDICLINAAAGLYAGGAAGTLRAAMDAAREAVEMGHALRKLEEFIEESRQEENSKSQ